MEQSQEATEAERTEPFQGFTPEMLDAATSETIDQWIREIDDELTKRKEKNTPTVGVAEELAGTVRSM